MKKRRAPVWSFVKREVELGSVATFYKETRKEPVKSWLAGTGKFAKLRLPKKGEKFDIQANIRTTEPRSEFKCAHLPAVLNFHSFLTQALISDIRTNVLYVGEKVKGQNVILGATVLRLPKKFDIKQAREAVKVIEKRVRQVIMESQAKGRPDMEKYFKHQQAIIRLLKHKLKAKVRFVPMPGFSYDKKQKIFTKKPTNLS